MDWRKVENGQLDMPTPSIREIQQSIMPISVYGSDNEKSMNENVSVNFDEKMEFCDFVCDNDGSWNPITTKNNN